MTDEELLAEVARHWKHWARHLGLESWRLFTKIDARLSKRNVLLEVQVDATGYLRATILINNKAPAERYKDLAIDVVHELLHIPLDKLDDVAWAAGKNWQTAYRQAEEGVIDFLAAAYYRLHEATECKE